MKHIFVILLAVLVVSSLALGQALMSGKAHDFTPATGTGDKGASEALCNYCHTPHVPSTGIAAPLWARKSVVGGGPNYGVYSSSTLDASVADVRLTNNYSSLCMSCHDGTALFALNSYVSRPYASGGVWDTTAAVGSDMNLYNGDYGNLSHTHPVNFDYNNALITADGGLNTPADAKYVLLDGTYGKVGRLFDGKMQCSSCHNPHATTGVFLQGTTDGGKLCIACHKK